jgi:hypothetical protein
MNANNGPCKVKGCDKNDPDKYKFKKFTEYAKRKAISADTFPNYNYLQIDDQLCYSHYLSIVETSRNKNNNKKRKFEEFNIIRHIEDDDHKLFCFNIDDYHSIHSYRNPDTTTLSSAYHMATCVAKTIENSSPIPVIKNNISIHNPENIEDWRINKYLVDIYIDSLSKSYNIKKYNWLSNNLIIINQFDRIELFIP